MGSLRRKLADVQDSMGRKLQLGDNAEEILKQSEQNSYATFIGVSPDEEILQLYSSLPIQFAVIRNPKKSFVIGSPMAADNWFPISCQVALMLGGKSGQDNLLELSGESDIRRINEKIVRDSKAFAGTSCRLVKSLALSK